ncbi:MAG TPA: Crp/Fnr family transcriptional regulator [Chitinophagaceae bacterium]|jgi:CRP-like cAMP-binding protein|nr:Crp/Fnr family transcriptional regulator [Chitinophagaceae bacterium]
MQSLYEYINRFTNVSPQEFEQISVLLETIHCEKKHILTHRGQVEKYLYIINKGLARKFFYKNKEEVITQIAKENDLLCSSVSFLSQEPSEYVVETLEACSLIAVSYDNLQKIYSMGYHMERLGRLITLDWLLQKESWEHDRLRHEPRERFIRFMKENNDFVQRVQQKYLASYLNMKPETFSRYKHLLRS